MMRNISYRNQNLCLIGEHTPSPGFEVFVVSVVSEGRETRGSHSEGTSKRHVRNGLLYSFV